MGDTGRGQSRGGGGALSVPSLLSPPVPLPSSTPLASTAPTSSRSDLLGLLCLGCRVLATMWDAPGFKFMIQATMARACPLGVPLPRNGGGAPTPTPVPPCLSPPTPSPSLRCFVGGGVGGERQGGTGVGVGASPPLRGRGTPKGQARASVD